MVSTVVQASNMSAYFVARLGNCRLGAFRLGFAPSRTVDIDVDQTGRYLWMNMEGQQQLDSAVTWTSIET